MSKSLASLLLCLGYLHCFSQPREIDSLKKVLAAETRDTSRIMTLIELSFAYFDKPDSALFWANEAYTLASKAGYRKGEAYALHQKGTCNVIINDNAIALKFYVESLKLAEDLHDLELIARNNMNIGNIFSWQTDYHKSIQYFQLTRQYANSVGDNRWSANMALNISNDYTNLNQLDSARIYCQQANEYAIKTKDTVLMKLSFISLGYIHYKMEQNPLSLEYYRLALAHNSQGDPALGEIALGIAKLFKKGNDADSAFYYAGISLNEYLRAGMLPALEVAELLSGHYEDNKNSDSAFKYLKLATVIKDSLYSKEKIKQIQTLAFEETLRQQAIIEEQRKAEKTRKNNLTTMAIGIFVSSCLLLALLLSHRKVKPKLIEVFGVISLLLVFEFISFFIHPYIDKLTDHNPILMFMILVAVAALLVPLHHKMEKLIKKRIINSTKLPAAE